MRSPVKASITAALACAATLAQAQPVPDTYEGHLAAATAMAGETHKALLRQCTRLASPPARPAPGAAPAARPEPKPDAAKVFDNLYYLGAGDITAWALKTSDGIILIDAMNNAKDAEFVIDAGLRRLGLDPLQIKYIVISHGHGDHYGGAPWLADRYKARVLMSAEDWALFDRPGAFGVNVPPPKRDMVITDGQTLTLGDTTVTFKITPGHTLGTVSSLFKVTDNGVAHQAAIWGGTGFNFAPDPDRFKLYADTAAAFDAYARRRGVDVMLSNHSEHDRAAAKIAAMRANPAGPNPFVDAQAPHRVLTALGECALANRVWMLAKAN